MTIVSRGRATLVAVSFLFIGGFLLTEHRADVFRALPYLFLLACPLLHLFGHGTHEGHGRGVRRSEPLSGDGGVHADHPASLGSAP